MFIILNSVIASLDGLIIGISLKLKKIKLETKNTLIFFIGNIIIYSIFISLYYFFDLKFMTKNITTILYLILAINTIKSKESNNFNCLTIKNTIFLTLAHSLDGTIVSLSFIYNYNNIFIILLFSISSTIILILGYYFAKIFKHIKKEELISGLLFIILAILNQFF